jgi:hypothetical protein
MSPKEHHNSLQMNPKGNNIGKMPDKEFKRMILRKLTGTQVNIDSSWNYENSS